MVYVTSLFQASVVTQHGVLVVVEVVVFAAVLYLCRWLPDVQGAGRKLSVAWPRCAVGRGTRRKSVDETMLRTHPHARARRPSEEALLIAGLLCLTIFIINLACFRGSIVF